MALPFPDIDPVLIQFGPLAVRWYSLAYLAGILLGWRYCRHLIRTMPDAMSREDVEDFILWATFGIVLGGRLGYVLFYNPSQYAANPLQILQIWQGGMSFHGGLLGMLVALYLFARRRELSLLRAGDVICAATPIGLFFGRVANFINGELYGRVADVPWAMAFPRGGPLPRHPSQLYEAVLEGLVLFLLLYLLSRRPGFVERPGRLAGVFMTGYAISRLAVELVREPDAQLGFLLAGVTMGQLLSLPMLILGLALIFLAPKAIERQAATQA